MPSVTEILGSSASNEKETVSGPSQAFENGELSARSQTISAWDNGYTAEVFVENTSDSDIVDPELNFDLSADIDAVWNGLVSEDGGHYRVTDNNSNTLEPGDVWRFAYRAYGEDQSLPDVKTGQATSSDSSKSNDSTSDNSSNGEVVVSGRTLSEWDDGYAAEVFVENTSDSDIADPEILFELPDDIDAVWNGMVDEDSSGYRITDNNPSVLEPGDVWRFAYRAYGDDKSLPGEAAIQGDGMSTLETSLQGISHSQSLDLLG